MATSFHASLICFNLCCVRTSFWLSLNLVLPCRRLVSIFVVLELLSDPFGCGLTPYPARVSIFVVLELLSDPKNLLRRIRMMTSFNLCCVRTSFWLFEVWGVDDWIKVSIFVVLELLSDDCSSCLIRGYLSFNLCCVRTSFWLLR